MTTQNEAVAVALMGRCYLYKLLRRIFGDEPNLELLKTVSGELTCEVLYLLLDDEELAPYRKLFDALRADDTALDRLKSEYTYLMIGPNKLPAPPWESVYVTKERLILQESTLKVRRAYLAYQFLPANYPHEADDHIAMELDFMARLSQMSQETFEAGDRGKFEKLLTDQKAFLEEHLLKWVGDFAEQMQNAKTHHFYPQMAKLTERVLRIDHAVLDELLSIVENEKERCNVNE